jgi:hypothetical protein
MTILSERFHFNTDQPVFDLPHGFQGVTNPVSHEKSRFLPADLRFKAD